jgi:hypothetical protein
VDVFAHYNLGSPAWVQAWLEGAGARRRAELHPFMDEEALEALVEDIVAHGQRQPIYCYQEPIIDGHNRYLACRRAGIEPWIRRARGD